MIVWPSSEVGHQADYAPLGTAYAQFEKTKDEKKVRY